MVNSSPKLASRDHRERKREQLREQLWPNSSLQIYRRREEKGFTTIPRTLPLIINLIDSLQKGCSPGGVYLDLWSRVFDEGFVEVKDEQALAYSAGYSSNRACRTWRDNLQTLVDWGFVASRPAGNRDPAYILLRHPHQVVLELHKKGRVREEWWNAFLARIDEIGTVLPNNERAQKLARIA